MPQKTGSANPESAAVAAAEAQSSTPMRVRSIEAVASSRRLTVGPDAPMVEVAALLSSAVTHVVVVCDSSGAPLGTISEAVLVRRLGLGQADFFTTRAADVMTRGFATCAPEDVLADVLAKMHEDDIHQMLLIDETHHLLGVLTPRDGLRALLAAGNQEETLLRNYVMGVGYQ